VVKGEVLLQYGELVPGLALLCNSVTAPWTEFVLF
jgi:hypothetical protein